MLTAGTFYLLTTLLPYSAVPEMIWHHTENINILEYTCTFWLISACKILVHKLRTRFTLFFWYNIKGCRTLHGIFTIFGHVEYHKCWFACAQILVEYKSKWDYKSENGVGISNVVELKSINSQHNQNGLYKPNSIQPYLWWGFRIFWCPRLPSRCCPDNRSRILSDAVFLEC